MHILNQKPLPINEIKSYVDDFEDRKPLQDYLKKFTKITKEKAKALRKDLEGLNNIKIKEEHLVKLTDFLPKNQEEVNKIFNDVSLSEEETNAIIEVVSKY
jgi:DNA-directed RNA polymerase subunit F